MSRWTLVFHDPSLESAYLETKKKQLFCTAGLLWSAVLCGMLQGIAVAHTKPVNTRIAWNSPKTSRMPYTKFSNGRAACPSGLEIKTMEECEEAAAALGITDLNSIQHVTNHTIPKWCSVRQSGATPFGNDPRAHVDDANSREKGRTDLQPICRTWRFACHHNTEIRGLDMGSNRTATTNARCAAACAQLHGCHAFTMPGCHFKSKPSLRSRSYPSHDPYGKSISGHACTMRFHTVAFTTTQKNT